jgi:alanine racemase
MGIRARIDLAALRGNFAVLRRAASGSHAFAVVKADAYGHGALRVAKSLSGVADGFAVARLGEAMELRDGGIEQPILLLEGVSGDDELVVALAAGLDLVVHEPGQIAMFRRLAAGGAHHPPPIVWLKADTGMNRLGFRPEAVLEARSQLLACGVALQDLRLMTHLARADEPGVDTTKAQLARLTSIVTAWQHQAGSRPVVSIGNSAGALLWPAGKGDWIRPGIALYGVAPSAERGSAESGLTPVMTLSTEVIALREVPRGETVGYGGAWQAARDSRIAILAAGYADGLPRHLPSGAPVAFSTGRAPLAGRVSMDMIAVDVTDLPAIAVGERAVLWGEGLPVEEVAGWAGTIAYELLCAVAPRVPREYVG